MAVSLAKSKVISKLYYSIDTETAISQVEQAKQIGITHVMLLSPGDFDGHFADFDFTHSPIENATLLPKLPILHEKISIGIQNGGSWVISDEKGLTYAVIVSFMMTTLYKSLNLRKARRTANKHLSNTSTEYDEQLELWESMGASIDTKHIDWVNYQKSYKVSHEDILLALMSQTSKKTTRFIPLQKQRRSASMSDMLIPMPRRSSDADTCSREKITSLFNKWKAKKLEIVALPSPSSGLWGYCCASCKKKLFSTENVYNHINVPVTLDPVHSKCKFITIEPMRWIGNQILDQKGKILCYGCSTELGEWNWKRWSGCGCGTKLKTSFAIKKTQIVFIPPKVTSPAAGTIASPRSKRKSKLGEMLSRKAFKIDSNKDASPSMPRKEGKEKDGPKVLAPVFATCYDELTKELQRFVTKAKLDPSLLDQNWYAATQIFRFVAKCRVIPEPPPTEEDRDKVIKYHKGRELNRLQSAHLGVKQLAIGTEYENIISQFPDLPVVEPEKDNSEDEDDEEERDVDPSETPLDPLAEAYIENVLGIPKKCTLPLAPSNDPDYFEKMEEKHLLPQNPKDTLKILEKAGKGGFGSVYMAKDSTAPKKNRVAIKRMPHSKKKEKISNFREIEFLAFCDHPNIVKYSRAYCFREEIWMVMEYMEGGSLKEAGDSYSFQEPHIAYIAKETLKALKYMHDVGLTHRDLKPGNIMLTVTGIVKLIDFGLCEEIDKIVRNPRMVGSPYWMPPEIILKAPYNEKVDVWSLGVTLLQLIDRKGFENGNSFCNLFKTSIEGRPNAFSSDNYSSNLRSFVQSMLTRDVQKRPSVDELLKHEFLKIAETRRNMEKVISQIFISSVVGITGF